MGRVPRPAEARKGWWVAEVKRVGERERRWVVRRGCDMVVGFAVGGGLVV